MIRRISVMLVLFLLINLIFFSGCKDIQPSQLIILRNNHIEVGVLPEVGGRVVFLRKPGLPNVLKSDSLLWTDSKAHKPAISPFSGFKPFNGHIVWIGPQKEWWAHQDLNPERREHKSDWPPDPYIIYGHFEITVQNDTLIKMVGPDSPVSGVRLEKEISITQAGIVTFTATLVNSIDKEVSWDIWMNTRLDGFAKCWVPVSEDGILDLMKKDTERTEATPYEIDSGFFTYLPSIPGAGHQEQVQEARLNPSAGYMAGFNNGQMLLIRFDKLDQNVIHPNHGQVELYSYVDRSGKDTLLELELHGPYKTLTPGESISLTESWQLFPYDGDNTSEAQLRFISDVTGNS